MTRYHSNIGLLTLISVLFFGGCYTELQVMDWSKSGSSAAAPGQRYSDPAVSSQPRSESSQTEMMVQESEYLEGYEDGVEDGWADAESYFFKDYESQQWYRDREINIWGPTYINTHGSAWGSPSWGWRSTFSYYDPFWDPYWDSGFSFHFGWNSWNSWNRWGYWDPWYSWNSWGYGYPYGYSTYPSYGYGWGWNNYWIQNNFYFPYTSNYYKERALRDYGPRSTGLSSASRSGERSPSGRSVAVQGKQSDMGMRTLRSASSSGSLERNREAIRTAVSRSATSRSNASGSTVVRSGATSRTGSSAVRSGTGSSRNSSPAVRSGSSSGSSGGSGVTRGSSGGTRSSGSSGSVSSGQSSTKSQGSSVRSSGSSGSSSSGSVSRSSGSSKSSESSSTPKSSSRNSNSRKGGN